MASLTIWHWLIVFGVTALIFHTAMPGIIGAAAKDALRDFQKATNLSVWFKIVAVSIFVLCLLVATKKLTAQ